jgi:hypothetical protein
VTAANTESATTADTESATTADTQSTATSTSSPAAEAEAVTNCLKGANGEVKQLTPGSGAYGIDAIVGYQGSNRDHVRVVFTSSPATAELASKTQARVGASPTVVGINVIAWFTGPTPANQQYVQGCVDQATGSG